MKFLKMPHGRISDPKAARKLFFLCWFSYVCTYLGRLNYAACLVEIMNTEGWTKGEAGLIATGFFATYGFGQLINGWIGDRLSPKVMVGAGLGFSGLVNLLFPMLHAVPAVLVLWCINGFVQSMIWSPLVRQLSEWMPDEKRLQSCVHMNSTVPVGTLAVYGLSAGLVFLGNWRLVFYAGGIILLTMSVLWFTGITRMEKYLVAEPPRQAAPGAVIRQKPFSLGKIILLSAMPLCLVAVLMQGMLKDGVTTWIPTFLEENFGLTAAASILCTTVVPIVNLGGVYLASWMNRRHLKNEAFTAGVFFVCGLIALVLLVFLPMHSAVLSLLLLAVTTTCMMGANTMLASVMPSYFVRFGICSTATGLLNGGAYLGSAISSYGNGAVAEHFGWNTIMYCWCICAAIGGVFALAAARKWKKFRTLAFEHPEQLNE